MGRAADGRAEREHACGCGSIDAPKSRYAESILWDRGEESFVAGTSSRARRAAVSRGAAVEHRMVPVAEGFSTAEVMTVLRQVAGLRISAPTLSRWVDRGLVVPSVSKSRASGVSHAWSAPDVIGLAWLLQARGDGLPLAAYRDALAGLWKRLPALLRQRGPLFFVVVGRDITVLAGRAVARRLSASLRQKMCLWPIAGSLRDVETALMQCRRSG
jgi:hypothetical protein